MKWILDFGGNLETLQRIGTQTRILEIQEFEVNIASTAGASGTSEKSENASASRRRDGRGGGAKKICRQV